MKTTLSLALAGLIALGLTIPSRGFTSKDTPLGSQPAAEDQYLVGDWEADKRSNLAVRRSNLVLMDTNFDGLADKEQSYGNGSTEDQYLVGDWDGDGKDNLAVRRGKAILMDTNFDGLADKTQEYGNGNSEDQYLVGDWDGDGKDNIAVRRGNQILMDTNFDGLADKTQAYGNGNSEDQYLVGDWDGDGKDNIAVRRGKEILMDINFDGLADRSQDYGNGQPKAVTNIPKGSPPSSIKCTALKANPTLYLQAIAAVKLAKNAGRITSKEQCYGAAGDAAILGTILGQDPLVGVIAGEYAKCACNDVF